ncbi:GntR family transcriptional regulator [Aestuariimicrobium ganziense]|uniref:GntR family transcriptional regulator n=1 Tax=Aestuariimicrobium ganziense TaxID=2773677 RepID=UPI0019417C55|nr:GntR family transcriptional regulator [Aestuariimicrobium ganziense]
MGVPDPAVLPDLVSATGPGVHSEPHREAAPASGRALLKDQAHDYIKHQILEGHYPPGRFLTERELTRALGMSKTPIRAAFERLEEQGLVTIAAQRGVVVTDLSPREVADHYDIRIALETFVVNQLAGQLPEDDQARLQQILDEQAEMVEELDLAGFTHSDADFHVALAACAGNNEIVRVMRYQRDRLHRVARTIGNRDPNVPTISLQEHRAILEAVVAGDSELATRRVVEHLTNGKRFLLVGGSYGQQW